MNIIIKDIKFFNVLYIYNKILYLMDGKFDDDNIFDYV